MVRFGLSRDSIAANPSSYSVKTTFFLYRQGRRDEAGGMSERGERIARKRARGSAIGCRPAGRAACQAAIQVAGVVGGGDPSRQPNHTVSGYILGVCGRYLLLSLLCWASRMAAQDPFEIHIYEYEPLWRGQYSLEAHLNIVTQGTSLRDGALLPTEHQTHLTLEPTFGLSENFALGFMFLNAWEPGYSPQFAGWRVLPHVYAPESWHLPVRLGFVAEFSFQTRQKNSWVCSGSGSFASE